MLLRNTDPAIMTFSFKQRDVKLLILHNIDNTSIFFFFCQENVFTHLTIMNYTIDKIISMYLFFSSCFFLNSSNFLSRSLAHSFVRSRSFSLSPVSYSQWLNADDGSSSNGLSIEHPDWQRIFIFAANQS